MVPRAFATRGRVPAMRPGGFGRKWGAPRAGRRGPAPAAAQPGAGPGLELREPARISLLYGNSGERGGLPLPVKG